MAKKSVIEMLKVVLADNYSLYLKTHNFHWNVEGANFRALHLLFEEQYKDLAKAIDVVAELIRGLGEKAPGTFEAFIKYTTIEAGDENATSEQMVVQLVDDQSKIQKTLQDALDVAKQEEDEVVSDFLIERLTVHRKAAWMLRSSLPHQE